MEENLIEAYKNLPLAEKRKELGKELTELTLVTQKMINDLNPNYKSEDINEFVNLLDGKLTEDEYLTGLYEDFLTMKDVIGLYYSIIMDSLYNNKN